MHMHHAPCTCTRTCHVHVQVTFAIKRGYWKGGATDPAFSFSGTYDPVTFEGARFCEVLTPAPLCMLHPSTTRCTILARCTP